MLICTRYVLIFKFFRIKANKNIFFALKYVYCCNFKIKLKTKFCISKIKKLNYKSPDYNHQIKTYKYKECMMTVPYNTN